MSYTKITDYAAKDGLITGNPSKIVRGTELGAEFDAIVTADALNLKTTALGTGIETFLGTPTSANLLAAVTNETGTGALVFATSPTLVTPALGTPTSGTLDNCTTNTESANNNSTQLASTAYADRLTAGTLPGAFTTLSATGTATIGSVANPTVSIRSSVNNGGAGYSDILLGNATSETRGYISYSHAGDTIDFGVVGETKAMLSATGFAVTGAFSSTSTVQGTQLISTVATGTAPLTVTSTTVVSNLHAEKAGMPQNSQSAAYTTVLADANKHILHPTADDNPRTFTIDSNANVPYAIGTCITFYNQINTVTIAITSDTLTLAGVGTTGSRTLAAYGMATALKVSTTGWVISGTGLS